jgi:ribosomal protein L29
MGSGKGSPEHWVAVVKPGRVMFELAGVPEPLAKDALRLAGQKLSVKTKIVKRRLISLRPRELRELSDDDLELRLHERRQELFNLRFQAATGALENAARVRLAKREIARILTVRNERGAMERTS